MRALVLGVFMLAACAHTEHQLIKRASFDLSCPKEQVKWTELDSNRTTYGAAGCGQRATYVYNARTDQWIMNDRASIPSSETPTTTVQSGPPGNENQQGASK